MSIAAILLAAGCGSRFSASGGKGNKLLAAYRGKSVVEWAIEHAAAAKLDALYVVWGAIELPLAVPAEEDVHLVRNHSWPNGMATSLQAGLTRAGHDGHDAVVVGLGDQPFVPATAWQRLADARARPVAVATYQGFRGNPVRLAASVWSLLPVTGEHGARVLMRKRPDLVVEVPCPGNPADIDSIADLDA